MMEDLVRSVCGIGYELYCPNCGTLNSSPPGSIIKPCTKCGSTEQRNDDDLNKGTPISITDDIIKGVRKIRIGYIAEGNFISLVSFKKNIWDNLEPDIQMNIIQTIQRGYG